MIAPDLETSIDELQDLVEGARLIAPFTGAGISTECGIPDFRSPGGLWTKNRPIPFDDFLASQEMRDEAWRRRFAMDAQFSAARPGRGAELPAVHADPLPHPGETQTVTSILKVKSGAIIPQLQANSLAVAG